MGGVYLEDKLGEMDLEHKDQQVGEKTCLRHPVPGAGRRQTTPTPQH